MTIIECRGWELLCCPWDDGLILGNGLGTDEDLRCMGPPEHCLDAGVGWE